METGQDNKDENEFQLEFCNQMSIELFNLSGFSGEIADQCFANLKRPCFVSL